MQTLCLLEEKGMEVEVVNYLEDPPTKEALAVIISQLGIKPLQLIRQKETVFQEQYLNKSLSDEAWILAMVENPILIERPIVISGNKAVIGRPPTLVLNLLK